VKAAITQAIDTVGGGPAREQPNPLGRSTSPTMPFGGARERAEATTMTVWSRTTRPDPKAPHSAAITRLRPQHGERDGA
jgi:hypothetical protein